MARSARTVVLAALAAAVTAGCSRPNYLQVRVEIPSALATQVEWLDLVASDAAADAGPQRIPPRPVDGGLGRVTSLTVTLAAPAGAQVEVLVNGLDRSGAPLVSGASKATLAGGSTLATLMLAAHCRDSRDCDDRAICAGTVVCTAQQSVGYGACAPASVAPSPGLACGPCHGSCQLLDAGSLSCRLPFCGCSSVPVVDAGEVCDDGPLNSDLRANACRSDCQPAHCGDGVIDDGERCDLGPLNGTGSGCNATCSLQGAVSTLAGDGGSGLLDGQALSARFSGPGALAVAAGKLYVADTAFAALREVDLETGAVTTLAGGQHQSGLPCSIDGLGSAASFCSLGALLPFDGGLLVADDGLLRLVDLTAGIAGAQVDTLAGDPAAQRSSVFVAGPLGSCQYGAPTGLVSSDDFIFSNSIAAGAIGRTDFVQQTLTEVGSLPGLGVEPAGMVLLGPTILMANTADPGTLFAFDPRAPLPAAVQTLPIRLPAVEGICTDGRVLFLCAGALGSVLQWDPATSVLSLVAGGAAGQGGSPVSEQDGVGSAAVFAEPAGCAFDRQTGTLYVSDRAGNTLRRIE